MSEKSWELWEDYGNHGNHGADSASAPHDSRIPITPITPIPPITPKASSVQPPGFLPRRGDYQTLLSYQKAEVIYEITYRFCQRFLKKRDRTYDQMVQAARSGKQNIIEGSMAAATSKEMEVKLTNVARASLEELLGRLP